MSSNDESLSACSCESLFFSSSEKMSMSSSLSSHDEAVSMSSSSIGESVPTGFGPSFGVMKDAGSL